MGILIMRYNQNKQIIMGLDMYLSKRTYVQNWDHQKPSQRHLVVVLKDNEVQHHIKSDRITDVVEQIMYWRKSNAIHAWFVENIQEGIDECQESSVTLDDLKKLVSICEQVVEDRNPELLPTSSGFYFGSTEHDSYYYEDVEETAKVLREEIESNQDEYPNYIYQASW